MDLTKLREIYLKAYRNNRFSYIERDKEYCDKIINVTFKYSVKKFNRSGTDMYLQYDVMMNEVIWSDCVGRDRLGNIVGVKTEADVVCPLDAIQLPQSFTYEDGKYHIKSNVESIKSLEDIRKKLYNDGFMCNGIHYVRWKRSSGSARVGKCMFMDEKLYPRFHRWEVCGL